MQKLTARVSPEKGKTESPGQTEKTIENSVREIIREFCGPAF